MGDRFERAYEGLDGRLQGHWWRRLLITGDSDTKLAEHVRQRDELWTGLKSRVAKREAIQQLKAVLAETDASRLQVLSQLTVVGGAFAIFFLAGQQDIPLAVSVMLRLIAAIAVTSVGLIITPKLKEWRRNRKSHDSIRILKAAIVNIEDYMTPDGDAMDTEVASIAAAEAQVDKLLAEDFRYTDSRVIHRRLLMISDRRLLSLAATSIVLAFIVIAVIPT